MFTEDSITYYEGEVRGYERNGCNIYGPLFRVAEVAFVSLDPIVVSNSWRMGMKRHTVTDVGYR